jgi:hypothetical protein
VKLDFFQCEFRFVPMLNGISSKERWDFFNYEMGFVPI